jgi:transcriptional regulator with XRE-family HTH domain
MNQLAEFRITRNLSQQAFAELLGTSPGYAHDLQTGRRKPSPSMSRRIEQITGIPRHVLRPDIFDHAPQETVAA